MAHPWMVGSQLVHQLPSHSWLRRLVLPHTHCCQLCTPCCKTHSCYQLYKHSSPQNTQLLSAQHHVKYSTTLISPAEAWESAHPMPKICRMLGNEQLSSTMPVHPGSCKRRDHQHLLAAPLKQPHCSNPSQGFSLLTAILSDSSLHLLLWHRARGRSYIPSQIIPEVTFHLPFISII